MTHHSFERMVRLRFACEPRHTLQRPATCGGRSMSGMPPIFWIVLTAVAWVGHAYIWTSLLSHLYGRPLPRGFLKLWRLITGFVILGFPLLMLVPDNPASRVYGWACLVFGAV